jgi:sulfur-oxidizing protein SoxX
MKHIVLATALLVSTVGVGAYAADDDLQALVGKYISTGFQTGDNQDHSRLEQDDTLKLCSVTHNKPSEAEAKAIIEREKATIKYPESGKLMGDWEKGKTAFTDGFAMRIGRIEPDKADKVRGGNCYACHAADPKEVAAGNLGSVDVLRAV